MSPGIEAAGSLGGVGPGWRFFGFVPTHDGDGFGSLVEVLLIIVGIKFLARGD